MFSLKFSKNTFLFEINLSEINNCLCVSRVSKTEIIWVCLNGEHYKTLETYFYCHEQCGQK